MCHGFLRDREGTITTFDPAGSNCTDPVAINDFGVITGGYSDSSGVYHGFLRAPNGAITKFNIIEAGTDQNLGVTSINDFGIITGDYLDSSEVLHGFVRAPYGAITTFDAPGVGYPFQGDGTAPQSINLWGTITGWYSDTNGTYHGFLRKARYGTEKK